MTTSKELWNDIQNRRHKEYRTEGIVTLLAELFERIEKIEAALPPTAWITPTEGPPAGETVARLCDENQP